MAATKLQAWLKSRLKRKQYISMLKSCIAIQRWRRSLCEARIQQQKYVQLRTAAVVIQSRRRGAIARRMFLRQRSAAVVIQSLVRRKQATSRYVRMKMASVLLQRWWRARLEMHKQRASFTALKQATITAQRLWRGRIVRVEQQRGRMLPRCCKPMCAAGGLENGLLGRDRRWLQCKEQQGGWRKRGGSERGSSRSRAPLWGCKHRPGECKQGEVLPGCSRTRNIESSSEERKRKEKKRKERQP